MLSGLLLGLVTSYVFGYGFKEVARVSAMYYLDALKGQASWLQKRLET